MPAQVLVKQANAPAREAGRCKWQRFLRVLDARDIEVCPDLVLLDIQLPGADGFATAELLSRLSPAPAVVLTSSRPASAYGPRLAQAPVRGFVAKSDLSGAALTGFLA